MEEDEREILEILLVWSQLLGSKVTVRALEKGTQCSTVCASIAPALGWYYSMVPNIDIEWKSWLSYCIMKIKNMYKIVWSYWVVKSQ